MNLYLMRHANAGISRDNPLLDAKRGLIKEGKEQCMLMARVLSALKVQVDVIASSPLKRALQTAQFVGTEMGYEAKVEISPALRPEADYIAFQQLLERYADRDGVLLVGHNPNLFKFLGRIITGNGGAGVRMRKGSVARIDMERHPPLLQWLIDPRMARWIYASVGKSSRPKTSRKVIGLLAQRPQLQFRPSTTLPYFQVNPLGINLRCHTQHVAGTVLVQGHGQTKQHHGPLNIFVFIGGNVAQCAVARLRAALAQIPRYGRNHRPLHLGDSRRSRSWR